MREGVNMQKFYTTSINGFADTFSFSSREARLAHRDAIIAYDHTAPMWDLVQKTRQLSRNDRQALGIDLLM